MLCAEDLFFLPISKRMMLMHSVHLVGMTQVVSRGKEQRSEDWFRLDEFSI